MTSLKAGAGPGSIPPAARYTACRKLRARAEKLRPVGSRRRFGLQLTSSMTSGFHEDAEANLEFVILLPWPPVRLGTWP